MKALLQVFWSIALLREGPQVLPASTALLAVVLAVHWAGGALLGLFSLPPASAALSALLATLVLAATVQGLLALRRRSARVTQTLTGLAGAELMLLALALPASALFLAGGGAAQLGALLFLGLLGWNLAIAAHVLRHALDVAPAVGLLAAIGYILVSVAVAGSVQPAP